MRLTAACSDRCWDYEPPGSSETSPDTSAFIQESHGKLVLVSFGSMTEVRRLASWGGAESSNECTLQFLSRSDWI
jgi:hypothetical protein